MKWFLQALVDRLWIDYSVIVLLSLSWGLAGAYGHSGTTVFFFDGTGTQWLFSTPPSSDSSIIELLRAGSSRLHWRDSILWFCCLLFLFLQFSGRHKAIMEGPRPFCSFDHGARRRRKWSLLREEHLGVGFRTLKNAEARIEGARGWNGRDK